MNKKYKIWLALLLVICLLIATSSALVACNSDANKDDSDAQNNDLSQDDSAPEPEVNFGIIADAQVLPESAVVSYTGEYWAKMMYLYNYPYAVELTEAIFKSAVDAYIAQKVDFVLFIGDLTDNRDQRSIEIIKESCAKLLAAGIPSYFTLGICDTIGVPRNYLAKEALYAKPWYSDNFAEFASEYMQGSITWYQDGFSYVADIPNSNIRLISLDTAVTYDGADAHHITDYVRNGKSCHGSVTITDEQMEWLEHQLADGKKLNRHVIVSSYFPIDSMMAEYYNGDMDVHFILQARNEELQNLFIKYDVKAVFSGHLHTECTKTYSTEAGSLLEVSCSSQCTYPVPIKVVTYYDNDTISIANTPLGKINASYLPEFITDEVATQVTSDLTTFSKECVKNSVVIVGTKKAEGYAQDDRLPVGELLLTKLCIYDETSTACQTAVNVLNNWLYKVNDMALYGTENSVEAICKQYGVTLPQSEYTTVREFALDNACKMYDGTFAFQGSTTQTLFKYIIYSGAYLLCEQDLFGLLHNVDERILECDLMPIIEKAFKEDTLDLTINDALLCLVSCIVPMVNEKTGLNLNISNMTTASLLKTIETLLPLALPALGDEYNAATEELWGIAYKEYVSFEQGYILLDKLISGIGASLMASLYSTRL